MPNATAGGGSSSRAVERIRDCLSHGAPWDACDAFREAAAGETADADLLFWGALAHARAGATHEAHALLDRAIVDTSLPDALRAEMRSLRGRLWKDELHRFPSHPGTTTIATRARDEYLAAFAIGRDPYPGINAASLSMLIGEDERAQVLATEVLGSVERKQSTSDPWSDATAAEARLLLGDAEGARRGYKGARDPGCDVGRLAAIRRQLRLLARVLPDAAQLLKSLPAPDIVAVTGHMIDAPDRQAARFPPALEARVRAAIRERVDRWHRPIVYASAACGADLLAVEAAQDVGAEVNVVLPFADQAFQLRSVAPGGAAWVGRFERALARASRVIVASDEGDLGDDVPFEHAALLVEGLAVLRAAQLETEPAMLAVLDAESDALTGGTVRAVERWRRCNRSIEVIDLRDLRDHHRTTADDRHPVAARTGTGGAPRGGDRCSPPRTLKSMLFADVAGYGRLRDHEIPRFQRIFWDVSARAVAARGQPPLLANTWGDALFLVFEMPAEAADLALDLRDALREVDWAEAGLASGVGVRIALHAGPVFRAHDPILGRENFFGADVTRAARIEPVTPPGAIYASEAFAAALVAAGPRCALEYVGTQMLAKRHGESRLYRVERG